MIYNESVMNKVITVQKVLDGSLSHDQATEHLHCSERTLYRYLAAYKKEWPPWLIHKLTGRRSNNCKKKREQVEHYAKQKRFEGFWPTLLAEKLEDLLWRTVPKESLRRYMIQRWIRTPRKPRWPTRRPRKRKDGYGIMVQFDGSYDDWLENGEIQCLLASIDDATWDIIQATFTQNESLEAMIHYRTHYFQTHGKPSIIYVDKHASYKVNHGEDHFDHTTRTRFHVAMNYLWIQVIFAHSPQAKGRVERKFRVFQDRWIKELRLAWIKDYIEAEQYLNNILIPQRNAKFSVQPALLWDFHTPFTQKDQEQLERYFAKKTKRVMSRVWVIRYMNNKYLIDRGQSLNGTRDVKVLESHLGNIQIWNGDKELSFKKLTY